MNLKALLCGALVLAAVDVRSDQKLTPVLTLQQAAVVASRITPGGRALVFGMVRHPRGSWLEVDHVLRIVTDDSRAGTVTWNEREPIPPVALFGVIDLQTGGIAFASPEGSTFRLVTFPGKGLHRGAAGDFQRFEAGHEFLDVIWVRPGVGAWSFSGGDGGSDSDHHADGRLSIDPADMKPVGDSPAPPKQYLPGDTLVWIDPRTREYATTEVAR